MFRLLINNFLYNKDNMRITRIYENQPLSEGAILELEEQNAAHLCRVLRLKEGAPLQVFDGRGHEFSAVLTKAGKNAQVQLTDPVANMRESPLTTVLGQVISRGEKMEFTIQKAVELGVSEIWPLTSVRCGVKLDADRLIKKQQAWQKIAAGAAEQCGRSVVPPVHSVTALDTFCELAASRCKLRLTLDPGASVRIRDLQPADSLCLLIGPEGGFDPSEILLTQQQQFTGVSLGPRILRTETAALTALSILGSHFGDL